MTTRDDYMSSDSDNDTPPTHVARREGVEAVHKDTDRHYKDDLSVAEVRLRYSDCGRCSFFLAGYKVLFGDEDLETAVAHRDGGWLLLTYTPKMRELINKSYGTRLDVDNYYYDGLCPECRRTFIFRAAHDDLPVDVFQIEI